MKCDNCKVESQWLEIVGTDFICQKCLLKNKVLRPLVKKDYPIKKLTNKFNLKNYEDLMKLKEEDVEEIVNSLK